MLVLLTSFDNPFCARTLPPGSSHDAWVALELSRHKEMMISSSNSDNDNAAMLDAMADIHGDTTMAAIRGKPIRGGRIDLGRGLRYWTYWGCWTYCGCAA